MKKFVNLSQNYKNLLNEIKNLFNTEILKKLSNNTLSFNEVNNIYDKINIICEKNNCNFYDLNKLINYYDKKNTIIEILTRITSLRNKYIVYYSKESSFWNENLKKIQENFYLIHKKKIPINKIEPIFIEVLKKYKYDWDGLWAIISLSKSGKITNINLFDIDDLNYIFSNYFNIGYNSNKISRI